MEASDTGQREHTTVAAPAQRNALGRPMYSSNFANAYPSSVTCAQRYQIRMGEFQAIEYFCDGIFRLPHLYHLFGAARGTRRQRDRCSE